MSHFYASIQGGRKEKTCTGHKTTGISSHVRGWNIGARVTVEYDEEKKKDVVKVYKTGGSVGATSEKLLVEFIED